MATAPPVNTEAKEVMELYKQRVTRSRFLHQMFLGLGGAMVFGFIGALTNKLLTSALATGGMGLPALGIVGIGIIGMACLYLGSQYLSNTIMLDQDYQAKKIAVAAHGKSPEVVQTPEIELVKPRIGPLSERLSAPQTAPDALPEQAAPKAEIYDIAEHVKMRQKPQEVSVEH